MVDLLDSTQHRRAAALCAVLLALACAPWPPPAEPGPPAVAADPCGPAAVEGLSRELEATPPEARAALVQPFADRCGDRYPGLVKLLDAVVAPVVVELPRRDAGGEEATPIVSLMLRSDGITLDGVFIEGSAGEGWQAPVKEALRGRMAGFLSVMPDLIIAVDPTLPYARVVTVMDLALAAGFQRVSLDVSNR